MKIIRIYKSAHIPKRLRSNGVHRKTVPGPFLTQDSSIYPFDKHATSLANLLNSQFKPRYYKFPPNEPHKFSILQTFASIKQTQKDPT